MNYYNRKAFSLPEILITVFILSLLATLVVPNLIRVRITAQDRAAQNTLRVLSKATEVYTALNDGAYPDNITFLTTSTPPYLNYNYCGQIQAGFGFACLNGPTGYTYVATPVSMGLSGTTVFTITTHGIMTP